MSVSFCYCDDTDGGSYCWLVDVAYPHVLRLASGFEEMRRLVTNEQTGRAAAESILREAVDRGNGCLAALARHTAPTPAAHINAVLSEARTPRSDTGRPRGDDPNWRTGVADALAWALGHTTSAAMRTLARAALLHTPNPAEPASPSAAEGEPR